MKKNTMKFAISVVALAAAAVSFPASAGMSLRSSFQDAALSIDAWGSTSPSGFLQTDIASGSTILAAYLYSTDVWGGGVAGDVTLNGTFYSAASGTLLPTGNPAHTRVYDVTSNIQTALGASGGVVNHSILEGGNSDGEVLVVVYKNASTTGGTAIIMDGGLPTGGATTHLGFASPYAGGDAIMSLASSFSYGDGQYTNVDVTTSSTAARRLTSAAGGNNDGGFVAQNGALITAGGFGDSTDNPADPYAHGAAYDDELYNLAKGNGVDASPFLKTGDTFVDLLTNNPSSDDNVFGLFFTTTFTVSSVDDTPITTAVPEPETYALMLAGLGLLGAVARRKKAAGKA